MSRNVSLEELNQEIRELMERMDKHAELCVDLARREEFLDCSVELKDLMHVRGSAFTECAQMLKDLLTEHGLRVTPLAALQAAMETTIAIPEHLTPSAETMTERCKRNIAEIETRDTSGETLEQRFGAEEGWLDNYHEIRHLNPEIPLGCLCGISVAPCPIHGGKS